MKLKTLLVAAGLLLAPFIARADDFTINMAPGWDREVTLMTDYISRGVSQTEGRPSFATTTTYSLENGFYAGLNTAHSQTGAQAFEIDGVAGWKTSVAPDLTYNAGIVYQYFPFSRLHAQDNVEFQNIVNYQLGSATLVGAFAVQPQGAQHAGVQTYTSLGVDFTLPYDVKLGGRVGYLTAQNHAMQANYVDWTGTIARDMGHGVTLIVQYTGSTYHCSACGQRVIGAVNISF